MLFRTVFSTVSTKLRFQFKKPNFTQCYFTIKTSTVLSVKTKEEKLTKEVVKGLDRSKANLILKMNFKTPQDALPFYDLPLPTLLKIYKFIKADEASGFSNNRLYYMSERIKYPPSELSPKLAKRTFIYTMSASWLEQSLDVLIEMGVAGDRIARDLWVVKYHHDTIRQRLTKVKDAGVDVVFPWMVRCSMHLLNGFIQNTLIKKEILGDMSKEAYLARRLKISLKEAVELCDKYPAVKYAHITKLKSILDYLFSEGMIEEDIYRKAWILLMSPDTIKSRVNRLHNLGIDKVHISAIVKTAENFETYIKTISDIESNSDTGNLESAK